ncbi:MAG: 4-vinyl reductase [Anaerolineae bacterium]|nr:4-vinyl reductase [Anaerolineae bacterium]
MSEKSGFFYPNRMGRIIFRSMEDLLGKDEFEAVLRTHPFLEPYIDRYPGSDLGREFPFEHLGALQEAVEQVHGAAAGRDINRRTGAGCLNNGLREFNPLLGIADLPVRMMPLSLKLHVGFDMFKMVFNRFSDQVVTLTEDQDHYYWIIERCPVCWGRHTDAPCCHLAVGILEEGLRWATDGRKFQVVETTCIAKGDETCTIAIAKRSIS